MARALRNVTDNWILNQYKGPVFIFYCGAPPFRLQKIVLRRVQGCKPNNTLSALGLLRSHTRGSEEVYTWASSSHIELGLLVTAAVGR